jgi:hypothetical protein
MKGLFETASMNLRSGLWKEETCGGRVLPGSRMWMSLLPAGGMKSKSPSTQSKQAVLLLSESIHAWNVGLWKQSSPLSQDGGCLRLTPGLLEFRMTYHIQRATQPQCLITWRHFQKALAVSPILSPAPVLIY